MDVQRKGQLEMAMDCLYSFLTLEECEIEMNAGDDFSPLARVGHTGHDGEDGEQMGEDQSHSRKRQLIHPRIVRHHHVTICTQTNKTSQHKSAYNSV